jgi:hypothetical protein
VIIDPLAAGWAATRNSSVRLFASMTSQTPIIEIVMSSIPTIKFLLDALL